MPHQLDVQMVHRHVRALGLGELVDARLHLLTPQDVLMTLTTSQGQYLARLGAVRQRDALLSEEALLLTLAGHGLAVPRLVGRSGIKNQPLRQWLDLPGRKDVQLSVFFCVPGHQVPAFLLDDRHARQVGHYLAAVHRVGRQVAQHHVAANQAQALYKLVAFAKNNLAQDSCLREAFQRVTFALARCRIPRGLPRGLVYGGLAPEQVHFRHHVLTGALNFGTTARGVLAQDLAQTLYHWGFVHDALTLPRLKTLVHAYHAKRPLGEPEIAALYPAVCRTALTAALVRMGRFELTQHPGALLTPSPFARKQMPFEDYRHDVTRWAALQALGAAQWRQAMGL